MKRDRAHNNMLYGIAPPPKFLLMNAFGIDISPKSVCAVQLIPKKVGCVPAVHKEVMLTEACELLEKTEDLERCEPLRAALKQLKEGLGMEFVKVSLPEMKTYTFRTSVPHEALATIEDALTVKLQENVPLDPSEILYDFQILPQRRGQRALDVVVTVFPKNVIATYTDLLKEVGLSPLAFESESQANARAAVKHADNTPYLIMHMGYTKVGLSIVDRGAVHYTSSIPYPSEEIVKDFTAQPAQALKAKINTLLVYWFTNKHNPDADEKISNVLLTGPYASSEGLVTFLEQHLRINVDVANVWQNCFDVNEFVPSIPQTEALKLSTAIGLSLLDA